MSTALNFGTANVTAPLTALNAPQVVHPNIPVSASAYDNGDCTYGVSQIYPSIYQYLGNAGTWVNSAKQHGYAVVSQPAVGTIVVYGAGGGYSQFGHVGVVVAVSGSTFTVLEMNYVGNNVWDERLSDMTDVEGFVVPPGNASVEGLTTATAANASTPVTPCITFSWSIAGSNICFDGAIGALAVGGGVILIGLGVIICVAFAIGHTKAGKAATDTLDTVGLSRAASSSRAKVKTRNATLDNEDMARAARLESIRAKNLAREERLQRARDRLANRELSQRSRRVSQSEIKSRQNIRRTSESTEDAPF